VAAWDGRAPEDAWVRSFKAAAAVSASSSTSKNKKKSPPGLVWVPATDYSLDLSASKVCIADPRMLSFINIVLSFYEVCQSTITVPKLAHFMLVQLLPKSISGFEENSAGEKKSILANRVSSPCHHAIPKWETLSQRSKIQISCLEITIPVLLSAGKFSAS
jgi:hypothetical protein